MPLNRIIKKEPVYCQHCGKDLKGRTARKYCSTRCSASHQWATTGIGGRTKAEPELFDCEYCGGSTTRHYKTQRFCSHRCAVSWNWTQKNIREPKRTRTRTGPAKTYYGLLINTIPNAECYLEEAEAMLDGTYKPGMNRCCYLPGDD